MAILNIYVDLYFIYVLTYFSRFSRFPWMTLSSCLKSWYNIRNYSHKYVIISQNYSRAWIILYLLQFHPNSSYCHIWVRLCEGKGEHKWWMIPLHYSAEKQPGISFFAIDLYFQSVNKNFKYEWETESWSHLVKDFVGHMQ